MAQFDGSVEAMFDALDARVVRAAKDHQSLARGLAEFRGEVRGRLGELSLPGPPAPRRATSRTAPRPRSFSRAG